MVGLARRSPSLARSPCPSRREDLEEVIENFLVVHEINDGGGHSDLLALCHVPVCVILDELARKLAEKKP